MPARSRNDQIEALYRAHNGHLHRIVQTRVTADPDTVDDACSYAWEQLLRHPEVRITPADPPLGWLTTVAVRRAWELTRRAIAHATRRPLSDSQLPAFDEHLIDQLDLHQRAVTVLANLTDRQQCFLLLKAAGYSYPEIAELTGTTLRAVDRTLAKARARLRD